MLSLGVCSSFPYELAYLVPVFTGQRENCECVCVCVCVNESENMNSTAKKRLRMERSRMKVARLVYRSDR